MDKLILKETKLTLNEATPVGQSVYAKQYNETPDKDSVINNFLAAFEKKYDLKLNINLKQSLANNIKQSGGGVFLDYLSNPYLQFLINYNKVGCNVYEFNSIDFDNLIHLYGDSVISQNNMFAIGQQGQNDIIFVQNLWENSYEEIKYICQAFYWLNNSSNFKSLNFDKVTDTTIITGFLKQLGVGNTTSVASLSDITQDFILFVKGTYSHTGILRKADRIYNSLEYLDSVKSNLGVKIEGKTELENIKSKTVKDPTKWSSKGIDIKTMNKDDAEELIKYIISTFNIKL
jgi:hypothetical protein